MIKYIKFPNFFKYAGITLFPFIFLNEKIKDKNNTVLINHEKIHLRQQIELLIFFFYIIYLSNYLFNLIKYKNHNRAYRNILFEREAYDNEIKLDYLENRKLFGWIR